MPAKDDPGSFDWEPVLEAVTGVVAADAVVEITKAILVGRCRAYCIRCGVLTESGFMSPCGIVVWAECRVRGGPCRGGH